MDIDKIKRFFDREANRYEALYDPAQNHYPTAYIRLRCMINLLDCYVFGGRVLDVGCGTGYVSKLLAFMGHEVDGIDISPAMIEKACNKHIDGASFWCDDIETANIPNDTYDGIVALGVLEYLKSDTLAIKQVAHTLKTGGIFVASWPNRLFNLFSLNDYTENEVAVGPYLELLSEFKEECNGIKQTPKRMTPPGEVRRSTPRQVRHLLSDHGFDILNLRYFHFHPYPPIFESLDPINYNKTGQEMEQFGYSPIGACMASCFMVAARKV